MSRSVVSAHRPRSASPGRRRLLATALAIVGLVGSLVLDAPVAQAASYPSWDDVVAARGKESAKQSQIVEIRGIIAGLAAEADAARAEAERLGEAFQEAQRDALRAAEKEQALRDDAEEHAEIAEASAAQAGRFAAQMARSGGADVTTSVITGGEDSRDLLYDLGALSKLSEQAERVETAATTDASVARSLTAQADRAALKLADLAQAAQDRMGEAQAASDRAQAATDEQEGNKSRLEAQLTSLTSGRATTEAQFEKGERIRKAEEERKRKALEAEIARQLRAQQAAAAANQGGGGSAPSAGGGGGGGAPVGSGSGSGWVRPAGGWITSGYGVRVNPYTGAVAMHDGLDLGSACSSPIVAASAGTVEYVGRYGGYGNYVRIDHGGGVKTAYGHIVDGGFRVSPGQQVGAGTLVALVGSTGNSTGCHLHFETHVGGGTVNPVGFMAARGVGF
ncbi:peptidoglycan DD-metalloendopeptidase family protein [Curtobacterium herbarum]|uniref:M23ase beta-sheet core domain-containing protein n=1 Tax=Curtobacterium herbarum TaxID=150122 RepID=A0ABN1ZFT7_9MICO|nr:M23 family metallopeptidase [Curtobacterium herbarum]MBM7476570.1 murein DD-endopeptidase MepM/ murein hydrolase activator NlpD [Curtobacterium herbarum]MCS6543868.1 peptidoglycan DD-metalloendopeptidase family protein [Curtobacterium herbarum]